MDLDEAIQTRDQHRPHPTDWAQLCNTCGVAWPCRPWRDAGAYMIGRVRDAFIGGARVGGRR